MREYLDFRIEISQVDEHRFLVNAACSLGETRGANEVDYDPGRIDRLVRILESSTVQPQELLELAGFVGELLLPGEVADLFFAAFPKHPDTEGIRLRLILRDPRLAAIPWEYAYLPLPGEDGRLSPYLALHQAVSIIRHEAQPVPPPALLAPSGVPFRILAASGLSLPDLPALSGSEASVIRRVLTETQTGAPYGLSFNLTQLDDPVTAESLETALRGTFDLFQFSGHSSTRKLVDGTRVHGFAIVGQNGGPQLLAPDQLAGMLLAASVRVAFLNVCSPPGAEGADRLALASDLVSAGVPAVIAMQFPIEDSHAVAFSKGLYSALATGLSLDEAVSLGRRRMHELGVLLNWGTPVTFSRSADGRLFTSQAGAASAGHQSESARSIAYQAGRTFPPEAPVEPGIRASVERFCASWKAPEIRDERAEINAVSIAAADTNELNSPVSDMLRVLGVSYPESVSEEQLCRQLGIRDRRKVQATVRRANQQLGLRRIGQLSRFSVEVTEEIAGVSPRKYLIGRCPVADLIDRSPDAHSGLDYHLRLALSLYDVGRYADAVALMTSMFDALVDRPGMLAVPELALFFYYLSKSLLKLNWYDELQLVLDGPYGKLSQSLLKDLEVERLHVAGMRLRQMGDLTAALTCFDGAVNILLEMLGSSAEPVLLRSLGDSYVLSAQCRLDQAVSSRQPEIVRAASLRTATEALEKAKGFFAQHGEATGAGIHYEGRMHGTRAFLGVATSLVQLDAMTLDRWSEIEGLARGGFEPERERKPFGIVAGKFALSVVLLAKARWHALAGSGDAAARSVLEQADKLLRSLIVDYLEPGYVQLGATFEMPKVRLAAVTVDELRVSERMDSDMWNDICSRHAIWSPLA